MPIAIFVQPTNETIPAGAIYASPNGVASNPGTAASPKDLASAYNATPANGTLVLTGSLNTPYRQGLTLSKKISVIAKPGDSPVLSGASIIPNSELTLEAGNIYFKEGFSPSYAPVDTQYADADHPQAVNLQQVFVNGVYFKQVATKGELVDNSFYVSATRLYIKGDITGKTVEVSTKPYGIVVTSTGSGSRVVGIAVTKFGNIGIHLKATATIDRVNTFYNGFRNVFLEAGASIKLLDVGYYYGGSAGCHVNPPTANLLVSGGKMVGNNIAKFAAHWTAAGVKMAGTFKGYPLTPNGIRIIEGLEVQGDGTHGIWLDNNCHDVEIRKNKVTGCLAAIMAECSFQNYIVDNLCYNNSNGVLIQNAKQNVIANNTLVLNNRAVVIRGTGRVNPDAEQRAAGLTWTTEDNELYNNIYDRTPASSLLIETATNFPGTKAISVMKNNAYNRESATKPANLFNWKNATGTYDSYSNLTDFRADYPSYEAGSIGRTAVTTATSHPFFTPGTMTVKADSPTINAGSTVSGVVADILGVADGTKVSIGSTLSAGSIEPPEPPAACSVEIEEAVAPFRTQVNLLNDDLFAANNTIESLTAERNSLQTQVASLQAQLANADTTSAAKLAEVKTQLQATLTYIG